MASLAEKASAQTTALVGMSEKAQIEAAALNAAAKKATSSINEAGDTARNRSVELGHAAQSVVDRTLELRSTIHDQAGALAALSTELSRQAENIRENFRGREIGRASCRERVCQYV